MIRRIKLGRAAGYTQIKGAGSLALGTALGQGIALAATPVLTRIYSPSDFGVLAVMAGLILTISTVSSLRCELAIPLPRRERAATIIAIVSLLILLLTVVVLFLLGAGPAQYFMNKTNMKSGVEYYLLVPAGVFLAGLYQVASMWAVRCRNFGELAVTRVSQGIGGAAFQIGFGIISAGPLGLILGQILGQAIGAWGLSKKLFAEYRAAGRSIKTRHIKWVLIRCKNFIRFDTPAALLNTAGAHVPTIMLATLLGGAMAGYYALSIRLLSAPVTLIGKTLSQSMLPDLVAARREGRLKNIVDHAIEILAKISIAPFIAVAILAPVVIGPLLGDAWASAARVAQWSTIWIAAQFIYSPISAVLLAVEAQRANLILQVSSFVLRIAAMYAAFFLWSSDLVVPVLSLVTACTYLIGIAMVAKLAGSTCNRGIFLVFKEVLLATGMLLPVIVLLYSVNCALSWVALGGAVSAIVWATRLIQYFRKYRNGLSAS